MKRIKQQMKTSIAITLIFLVSAIYLLVDYNSTKTYCGVITQIEHPTQYTTVRKSSHYLHTERYVLIKFDNRETRAINLNPTSYYTARVGQRVCLELNKDQYYGYYQNEWLIVIAVVGLILSLCFVSVKIISQRYEKF